MKRSMVKVALLGNPNSGKTSVYNRLTGLNQQTGNFPGVTVDKKTGIALLPNAQKALVTDLPGTYSLYPRSEDQKVVLRILLDRTAPEYPDLIIYVADSGNLDRHLLLLTQVMDLGLPVILCLNMVEQAAKAGSISDTDILSSELKISVVSINGRTGEGIDTLKKAITENNQAAGKPFVDVLEIAPELITEVRSLGNIKSDFEALLLSHHVDSLTHLSPELSREIHRCRDKYNFKSIRSEVPEIIRRYEKLKPITDRANRTNGENVNANFTEKLDRVLTHKIFGSVIFIGILFLMFQAIFAWAAYPMEWIDTGIAKCVSLLQNILPAGLLTDLLTGGIIPGVGGIVIFIPQIAILFGLVAILEETGYMARAVYLSDRIMQKFGMNGRSLVALISGAACAVPAIMSARTISNSKERLITIFVTPFITCSARIPVFVVLTAFVVPATKMLGIINIQGLIMMALYFIGVAAALISAYIMKRVLRSSELSFLMMELPGYKTPHWKNVLVTVIEKVRIFVFDAGKIILAISIVLWVLASFGPGDALQKAESEVLRNATELQIDDAQLNDLIAAHRLEASFAGEIGKFIEPVIIPLGFDWKIGIALISSFAAREVFVGTMATLYSVGSSNDERTIIGRMREAKNTVTGKLVYNPATALSLLMFYVLAMQCMSTLAVVYRETKSWIVPVVQLVYMTGLAYLMSWITYSIFS